jgi:hypothetical protein
METLSIVVAQGSVQLRRSSWKNIIMITALVFRERRGRFYSEVSLNSCN